MTVANDPRKRHILIVKHGALGDVVRTSYFAGALRRKYGNGLRLSWVTAPPSFPLLRYNPAIDNIWTDFSACRVISFDHVYSLDDEIEIIENVMKLKPAAVTGAVIHSSGAAGYTNDAAGWFDMGLLSRYGKEHADRLKKRNVRSHSEIFSEIFDVARPRPEFWGLDLHKDEARALRGRASLMIGINPYAGHRWPSKELPPCELGKLVAYLLDEALPPGDDGKILLFGAGADRLRNLEIIREIGDPRVVAPDTDDSVLRLAAHIGQLDYLVSSDALALHLAVAQQRAFLAFFAPTSAAEIDTFGLGAKMCSTTPDYCSYRKDADNGTITADRIFTEMVTHRPDLFEQGASQNAVPLKIVS